MGEINFWLLILLVPPLAFLPTIIAVKIKHPYKISIILSNIIAGLMFLFVLGWPGVLVWLVASLWSCVVPNQRLSKGMMAFMFLLVVLGARLALTFSPLIWGWSVDGSVTDAESSNPLPDAWVVVQWKGSNLLNTDVCVHVEVTKTDAQGRYHVPAWIKNGEATAFYLEHSTAAYKVNYIDAQPKDSTVTTYDIDIWLGQFAGTISERVEYLKGMTSGISCSFAGASERSLFPVYVDIYEEAKTICSNSTDIVKKCQEDLQYIQSIKNSPYYTR